MNHFIIFQINKKILQKNGYKKGKSHFKILFSGLSTGAFNVKENVKLN